jgi:hypothetical protein
LPDTAPPSKPFVQPRIAQAAGQALKDGRQAGGAADAAAGRTAFRLCNGTTGRYFAKKGLDFRPEMSLSRRNSGLSFR